MHNHDDMKRKGREPVTKDDLDQFAAKVDFDRFATKDDLDRFATKDDLLRFATKDDLLRFATKDDLLRFATKDDLEQFSKKDDLARFAAESNSRMDRLDGRLDDMTAVVMRQSMRIVKVEASVDNLREDVISALKGVESRLTERMDAFMSNTLRVDRDNILLVHRMDKVEGRVSELERRAP